MTWQSRRPIYNRLPQQSETWVGNSVVDWLTSFWDELLCETKDAIDNPSDWLGPNPDPNFMDWVGVVLCGLGEIWRSDYPLEIKQRLITNWITIAEYRGSELALTALVKSIDPGARIHRFKPALAGVAQANWATIGSSDPGLFFVLVSPGVTRFGAVWNWLQRVIDLEFPAHNGQRRLQPPQALAGVALPGDIVGGYRTLGYGDRQ